MRLFLNQKPIAPAAKITRTMATAIPAMAGVPSELEFEAAADVDCDGCDVDFMNGGTVDEGVLVGTSKGVMGTICEGDSLEPTDCEMEKFPLS